jgi:hypothetical protein
MITFDQFRPDDDAKILPAERYFASPWLTKGIGFPSQA